MAVGYIPTLDGWRALAVIWVIAFHGTPPFSALSPLTDLGWHGVNIFFGLSGFLICTNLLREEQSNGRIDLFAFYSRRAFRILPPALTYLAIVGSLGAFGFISSSPLEWLSSVFFFRNYISLPDHVGWATGHFWSLSVEEHFYLIFPGLLMLTGLHRARVSVPVLALSISVWRYVENRYQIVPIGAYGRTDIRIDGLLWGCALALWMVERRWQLAFQRVCTPMTSVLFSVTLLLIITFQPPLSNTLEAMLIPLVIYATVVQPTSAVGRFLECSLMRWIGRMSYSLYIWQTLFFVSRFWQPSSVQTAPLNVMALLGCAVASHYLIERPALTWGKAWIAGHGVKLARQVRPEA
jgi:peptidoglycan/LPS O-acetylase OafA/YrhL